mmetsp:Transcript_4612/g.7992  ORF Transcript_4612/g.7992 Transcript_4612/m.7992 type:complete len:212 (+) Transcript_4612:379-1014(+)
MLLLGVEAAAIGAPPSPSAPSHHLTELSLWHSAGRRVSLLLLKLLHPGKGVRHAAALLVHPPRPSRRLAHLMVHALAHHHGGGVVGQRGVAVPLHLALLRHLAGAAHAGNHLGLTSVLRMLLLLLLHHLRSHLLLHLKGIHLGLVRLMVLLMLGVVAAAPGGAKAGHPAIVLGHHDENERMMCKKIRQMRRWLLYCQIRNRVPMIPIVSRG